MALNALIDLVLNLAELLEDTPYIDMDEAVFYTGESPRRLRFALSLCDGFRRARVDGIDRWSLVSRKEVLDWIDAKLAEEPLAASELR